MLAGMTVNSSDSSTAVPSVPPIWRKKVDALVATPMSRRPTEFWLAMVRVCISWPRPRPMSSMAPAMNQYEVSYVQEGEVEEPARQERRSDDRELIRYRPVRAMIWPLAIEEIIRPRIIGSSWSPLSVGVDPSTSCRYSGRVSMAPNMPKPTKTPMMVAIEKVDERNSLSGISASSFIAALDEDEGDDAQPRRSRSRRWRRRCPSPSRGPARRRGAAGRARRRRPWPPTSRCGPNRWRCFGRCRKRSTMSEGDDADRHVDEEHPAPSGDAEDLVRHRRTGRRRAGRRGSRFRTRRGSTPGTSRARAGRACRP